MRWVPFHVCVVVTTLLGSCSAWAEDGGLLKRVDELFASCDKADTPGCAVGIMRNGELIYGKGFGSANLVYGVPNTPDTLFEIASASKSFTSMCIAILMDQGKVQPGDDVRKFLPELRYEHTVRIRDMLRCESGIWAQYHIMPLAGWENVPIHPTYSKADVLSVFRGQRRLQVKPGTEFQYGSGDFFLLGMVVERVSGMSLAEFAKRHIFDPLGMRRTHYVEDPGAVVKNVAAGHWQSGHGWSSQGKKPDNPWRLWMQSAYTVGGSGLRTTINDLAKFNRAFELNTLPRGKYLDEFLTEGTVLGNRFVVDLDAYRKRTQKHAENPPAGRHRGLKRIQFTGGFWGFTCCFARYPEQNCSVFCLSNSDRVSAFSNVRKIAELLLEKQMDPVAATQLPVDESVELSAEELQQFTGAFRHKANTPVWRMVVRDGNLTLVDHLDKAVTLMPVGERRFKAVGDNPFYPSARFDFEVNETGKASRVTLSSHENNFKEVIPFGRVELWSPSTEQLADFAGVYVSEELAATYRVKVEADGLWLRVNSRRWERVRPVVQDQFTPRTRDPHDQRFLQFTRDESGKVDGLSAMFWRIRGVRFERR